MLAEFTKMIKTQSYNGKHPLLTLTNVVVVVVFIQ